MHTNVNNTHTNTQVERAIDLRNILTSLGPAYIKLGQGNVCCCAQMICINMLGRICKTTHITHMQTTHMTHVQTTHITHMQTTHITHMQTTHITHMQNNTHHTYANNTHDTYAKQHTSHKCKQHMQTTHMTHMQNNTCLVLSLHMLQIAHILNSTQNVSHHLAHKPNVCPLSHPHSPVHPTRHPLPRCHERITKTL